MRPSHHDRHVRKAPRSDRLRISWITVLILGLTLLVPAAQAISLQRYGNGSRSKIEPSDLVLGFTVREKELYTEPLFADADPRTEVSEVRRVAVIGAGIAGIDAAHHLSQYLESESEAFVPQITVFERDSRIGGRVHTVRDEAHWKMVETGGDMFDVNDLSISRLAQEVGVDLRGPTYIGPAQHLAEIATWDGSELNVQSGDALPTWENFRLLVWRYGLSLRFWQRMARATSWAEVSSTVKEALVWGQFESFLELAVRLASSAAPHSNVHALAAFGRANAIDLYPKGSAWRGNERFLKRLIRISGANLKLNSTVTHITRYENLEYDVHWYSLDEHHQPITHVDRFDAVIIAAPFDLINVTFDPPLMSAPDRTQYTPIYVTQFFSIRTLDPILFNLPSNASVPDTIWAIQDEPIQSPRTRTSLPSFLTLSRETLPWDTFPEPDNYYKITSREPLTEADITLFLNHSGIPRKDVTFPNQKCGVDEDGALDPEQWAINEAFQLPDERVCVYHPTVRWLHQQFWPHAFPVLNGSGSGLRGSKELAPRLYYTSAFERTAGASLFGSVLHAESVARKLIYGHMFVDFAW